VVVYFDNYEIITNSNFILLSLIALSLLLVNVTGIYYILRNTNRQKYIKKLAKIKAIYEKYMELLCSGFLYNMANDLKSAENKRIQAVKVLKNNNLSKVLESSILLNRYEFQKCIQNIKNIKNKHFNDNHLIENISLLKAVDEQDSVNIEFYCKKILEYDKKNSFALTNLYYFYKSSLNWDECEKLLKIIEKNKIFSKENIKIEDKIIKSNLKDKSQTKTENDEV
jgi:hypothetical protein